MISLESFPIVKELFEKLNEDVKISKALKGVKSSFYIEILPVDESFPRIIRLWLEIDSGFKVFRFAEPSDYEKADYKIRFKDIDEIIDPEDIFKALSGKLTIRDMLKFAPRFTAAYTKKKIIVKGNRFRLLRILSKIYKQILRIIPEVIGAENLAELTYKIQKDPENVYAFINLVRRNEFKVPHIIIGTDSREFLSSLKGKKAMIVTDKVMVKLGFVDEIVRLLKLGGMKVKVFDEAIPEPPISIAEKGAKLAKLWRPNYIIGLGGGSSMDLAKSIYFKYLMPKIKIKFILPLAKIRARRTKLILIPTTSGTGSETTWASVLTEEWFGGKRKAELASRDFIPDYAILDTYFVRNLPRAIVASTGLDAFSHALEAYLSYWHNDITDALAIHAMRLIFKYLPRSYLQGDEESREKMHIAASMAGMAFGNSQAGIGHGLGHPLGAVFHIPHGLSVSVFMPYEIDYFSKAIADRIAELSDLLGFGYDYSSRDEKIEVLRSRIVELIKAVGGPLKIADLGIRKDEFINKLDILTELALKDACTGAGYRMPSVEEIKRIYMYVYEGKRIDF